MVVSLANLVVKFGLGKGRENSGLMDDWGVVHLLVNRDDVVHLSHSNRGR